VKLDSGCPQRLTEVVQIVCLDMKIATDKKSLRNEIGFK